MGSAPKIKKSKIQNLDFLRWGGGPKFQGLKGFSGNFKCLRGCFEGGSKISKFYSFQIFLATFVPKHGDNYRVKKHVILQRSAQAQLKLSCFCIIKQPTHLPTGIVISKTLTSSALAKPKLKLKQGWVGSIPIWSNHPPRKVISQLHLISKQD